MKIALENLAAYPTRFFSPLYGGLVSLVFFIFVWKSIYEGQNNINGFSFQMIVTYYAVLFATKKLIDTTTIARTFELDIQKGELSKYLIKPVDYTLLNFVYLTVDKVFKALPIALLMVFLTAYFKDIFVTPKNLHLFMPSLILAMLINFLMFAVVGSFAFHIVKIWGIRLIIDRLISILSGALIPLSFFPDWANAVLDYMPFKYSVYVPLSIYIGEVDANEGLEQIGLQLLWFVVMVVIYFSMWKVGLKKYDSVGN